jgi:predicted Zn-dependent peptidase
MYQLTQLGNGLTVATASMPQMASVCVGLWVGVGSRHEPSVLNGAAHFIEHLLFKGTRRRTAQDISQDIEGLGGYLNAFTSEETSCFFARACHDRLPELLDVLLDMFLNSKFDPLEIRKEREVIKEEVAMYRDQPQNYVHELLNAAQWPDQPLGRSITGTEESLDRLTRACLRQHQQRNYLAANTVVVAAGHVSHRSLVNSIRSSANAFGQGPKPTFDPAFNTRAKPWLHLHTRDTEQTQIAWGIRTCSRHDERRYALRLLNALLGENMSSRLFQVLREDLGLAYSINTTVSYFEDAGDLSISAGLDDEHLPKALAIIRKELRRFREITPAKSDLNRAKDYVIGQSELSLEGTENHMMWLGEQLLGYGRIIPPSDTRKRLQAVTPAQIRAVARDFLQPERMTLAMISPLKSARHLECWLGV